MSEGTLILSQKLAHLQYTIDGTSLRDLMSHVFYKLVHDWIWVDPCPQFPFLCHEAALGVNVDLSKFLEDRLVATQQSQ